MHLNWIFAKIIDVLWEIGGVSAAADLHLDDFGPVAYEPCPATAKRPAFRNPKPRA